MSVAVLPALLQSNLTDKRVLLCITRCAHARRALQGAASQVLPNKCMAADGTAPCLTCVPPGTPKAEPGPVCEWAWLGKAANLDACQALATAVDGLPGRSDVVCQTATWCHAEVDGAKLFDQACYCGLGTYWKAPSLAQTNTDATICVRFGTPWGTTFLMALVVFLVGYVGVGVGYSMRTSGAPASLRSHPHWARWQELRSLCTDGMAFAQSGGSTPPAGRGVRQPLGTEEGRARDATKGKAKTKKDRSASDTKGVRGKKDERRGNFSESGATVEAATPAVHGAAAGTVAGGGGRWMHVPG